MTKYILRVAWTPAQAVDPAKFSRYEYSTIEVAQAKKVWARKQGAKIAWIEPLTYSVR